MLPGPFPDFVVVAAFISHFRVDHPSRWLRVGCKPLPSRRSNVTGAHDVHAEPVDTMRCGYYSLSVRLKLDPEG